MSINYVEQYEFDPDFRSSFFFQDIEGLGEVLAEAVREAIRDSLPEPIIEEEFDVTKSNLLATSSFNVVKMMID